MLSDPKKKKKNRNKYDNITLNSGFVVSKGGLDSELVGGGDDHFEDGHEGGDLAEVAAADHLSVDLQSPLVVLTGDAAADLVESIQDIWRKLKK